MKEALLIWACYNGGDMCSTTYSAYYEDTVALRESIQNLEERINRTVGEENIKYLTPIAFFIGGTDATIPLYKTVTLVAKDRAKTLNLNYNYSY